MNWKTTLVLLAIVGGLGIWLAVGESTMDPTPGRDDPKIFKPAVKVDDVTRVEIARGKGLADVVVLAKDDKTWKLEKPVADKADEGKVRELLSSVEFLDAAQKMEGDKAKEANFGEVEARLTITRPKDKGGDVTVELGRALASDTRFLRVAGREAVYLIKKELYERASWDVFEFRTKELATLLSSETLKFVARTESEATGPAAPPKLLELVKGADNFWRMGEGGEIAETKKATDLIDKVRELKPASIVTEKPTDEDLAKFGLKPAVGDVALTGTRDGKPVVEDVLIGKKVDGSGETRYVRLAGRDAVYKAEASDLLRELRRDPAALRNDALLPLHAGVDGVVGLEAKWNGGSLALKKKDNEWVLTAPGNAKGDEGSIKALLKQLADLKIASREEGKLEDLGLTAPGISISIDESGHARTLDVGNAAGTEGTFFVRRGNEAKAFTAKLGDLPKKLQEGVLGLRAKTIFKATHWDATAFKLTDADGKVTLDASKKGAEWTIAGLDPKQTDPNKVNKVLEPFDDLKAESFVAPVVTATLGQYGLDKPTKLTMTIEAWSAEAGSKKKEDKTLAIGKREGDLVYVLDEGSTVVAKVKAEFLDLISRGFRKGKEIFNFSSFDATSFVVKEGDKEILKLEKKKVGNDDEWSIVSASGESKKLTSATEVRDKLLTHFERVEAFGLEDASDAKKKDAGLAPTAWRTVIVTTKPSFGEQKDQPTTKTLLLGKRAGEHDVWAMEQGGGDAGVIYDGPVQKLDAFIASPPISAAPPPSKEAPATVPGTPAAVTSPDAAPVGSPTK